MKTRYLLVVLMVILLVAPVAVAADSQGEMLAVVQDMMAASNLGDIDGTMAYWTPDGVMNVTHLATVFTGAAEVRALFEMLASQAFQMDVIQVVESTSDTLVTRTHMTSAPLQALAVEVESRQTYTFRAGKISKLVCSWTPESLAALQAANAKAAVTAMVSAVQRKDVGAYMASWADDAVMDVVGSDEQYAGAQGLRAFYDSRLAIGYRPEITSIRAEGNTVYSSMTHQSDMSRALGIPDGTLQSDEVSTVVDGKIARMDYTWRPESLAAYQAGFARKRETYVVKSGDWLSKIAADKLGNMRHWNQIYVLNMRAIGDNPNLIIPGQTLELPSQLP